MEFKELETGQVFNTKKGHKIEIVETKEDDFGGIILTKLFVHRDSQNISPKDGTSGYSWAHNTKWFSQWFRFDEGKNGLKFKLENEGYRLEENRRRDKKAFEKKDKK